MLMTFAEQEITGDRIHFQDAKENGDQDVLGWSWFQRFNNTDFGDWLRLRLSGYGSEQAQQQLGLEESRAGIFYARELTEIDRLVTSSSARTFLLKQLGKTKS